jgi:hypothetical protein
MELDDDDDDDDGGGGAGNVQLRLEGWLRNSQVAQCRSPAILQVLSKYIGPYIPLVKVASCNTMI